MKEKINISSSYAEYKTHLEIKNKADSTIADYSAKALKLIKYIIQNEIDILTIEHIESYLAKNKKKNISNNTYAKFVFSIRICLNSIATK